MSTTRKDILWVDDEIELLRPHTILLEHRGYSVDTATNGEDAIEMFKANPYRLIFLDESMVGMSGLETLSEMKEIDASVPIVMVTKNEAESLMEEAIGLKINDYLTKPVNPTQILAACKKFLEVDKIRGEKVTQNYFQGFNEIARQILQPLGWDEWVDIYSRLVNFSRELDKHKEIGLEETLANQWRDCNAEFSKFVESEYEGWVNGRSADGPLMSPDIVDNFVVPHLKNGDNVLFFVIDCMRLDQWLIMEELIRPLYTVKREYYSSILPTATPYARNSIFAGLYPSEIEKHYPQYWIEGSGEDHSQNKYEKELLQKLLERKRIKLNSDVKYAKIIDTDYGKKIERDILSYASAQLSAIVVNVVDMIAHSRSDYAILKEIAPDEPAYRSLTESWFRHSSLYGMFKTLATVPNLKIVVTTDHGAVRCMRGAKAFGDRDTSTCLRFKFGRNVKAESRNSVFVKDPQAWKLPRHLMTTNYIIAKEDFYFVYPTDYHHYLNHYRDSFQHGGISMEEMILPVVLLEAK